MTPFEYHNATSIKDAASNINHESMQVIAGGTTMLDLMKMNVLTPKKLVHVRDVLPSQITLSDNTLSVGAAAKMADLADAAKGGLVFPAIRQSLILAASPQIRNMATIGGNLLQRPRSTYFRHTDMPVDGRPTAGFGKDVDTSLLAVLGNGGRLVGMYPGDFAVTVLAFDAEIELSDGKQSRKVKARDFYQVPSKTFVYSTALKPNELITAVHFPVTPMLKNSFYLKIRERSSYAFALASVSVGLDIQAGNIRDARVGLGGLGSIPWHSPEAEQALIGQPADDQVFEAAAEAALASAQPPAGLEYKVSLAKRTLVRALQTLRDQGPLSDDELWAMQHGRPNANTNNRSA